MICIINRNCWYFIDRFHWPIQFRNTTQTQHHFSMNALIFSLTTNKSDTTNIKFIVKRNKTCLIFILINLRHFRLNIIVLENQVNKKKNLWM